METGTVPRQDFAGSDLEMVEGLAGLHPARMRQGVPILSRRVLVCPWWYLCAFVCYFVLSHEPCRRSPDSPRRPAVPLRADPLLAHGLGTGCAGRGVRRTDPHGKLVEKQYRIVGGGAGAGAVHAVHGEVAAVRRSRDRHASTFRSPLVAAGLRHLRQVSF